MRWDPKVGHNGDFAPATGWVEGHTGAARVRRMTCSNRVVKPVCAVASRIWRVRGELRACRGTWRWGDKSRPRGMRSAILNGRNLRNHVIATARCPFGFSHRSCDEVSKWAVPLLGYAKQAAGKRAIRGAQRVPRRSAVGRSAAAAVGRPVGRPVAVTMRSVGRVGCGFSFSRADVKTPEFRGSFSLKLRELCQI